MTEQRIISIDITHLVTAALARGAEPDEHPASAVQADPSPARPSPARPSPEGSHLAASRRK